ncbi:hypothetical protein JCGZ_11227 [Jatropha curcas]|uniref:Agmatine coumaroyltransferase-2-like n=1 Tax=Jatropha curcas TaxID=180498 RepID=A0A067KR94_JATCU|nr:hypothetical protein JCGZ_11227 [Jatropha curcas]
MDVKIMSTKPVKPIFEGNDIPPSTSQYIPLSVFDKFTYNTHMAVIFAYRPPTPSNATFEHGLQIVLSKYRVLAGRFGEDENGDPVIFLNDKGVKLVEASVDGNLDQFMPLHSSPELLGLHPTTKGVEELLQIQLTRFNCGSLIIGYTSHHKITDAQSGCNFLVAWGKATRGLDIDPLPILDGTFFVPRNPPIIEFEHRGFEFESKKLVKAFHNDNNDLVDDIVIHKVHFTMDFLSKLKAKVSENNNNLKPYTTFESLVAHLWRVITKSRGVNGFKTTRVKISINGRRRMNPRVPDEYYGNLVLWAFPSSRVKDLLDEPLAYAAKLIHDAIANINDNYFKSFIDFASCKEMIKEEELVSTADIDKSTLYPDLEVDSWVRFPFYELDFGGGSPYLFMPSYYPLEGMFFLQPSFIGGGSIDTFVPLFRDNLETFKKIVYSID